ncbi:ADP-ribose glycohydrolase MACROD1 isoform X2 [Centropristis striata]|uniref:ADP-ribose glycohydrolase MACROD1 isoform X2 n=1 Tax=Centropristis striata TaxID=184440 RepID=UPI0027E1E223|nr:ADP-ribose glycohydrolase MACROD1 isoform X2 [Centropristis striata]
MATQISALFSYIRAPLCGGPMSRVRADFQGAGVKFKHFLSAGSPRLGAKPATSPARGHINAAQRAQKFSTTTAAAALWKTGQASSSPRGSRGWVGKLALGVALGVSTAALVQSLHTGTVTAMARKVKLDSAEGDWKQTKDFLLSLSVTDRRQHYRTSNFVPLDDISVWTPTAVSDGAEKTTKYTRNKLLDKKISLYSGDITMLEIDAIVNAANKTLLGGGGVDGAIHRAAGPLLKKECASLHGCETGESKISCGYGLPAKYVIHTVGPIAHGGVGEEEKKALRSCYENSLITATKNEARTVAFPCISTGIYGYPPEQAVQVALATVREYLDKHHDKLDRVIFCVFLPTDKELYLKNLPLYFPADTVLSR